MNKGLYGLCEGKENNLYIYKKIIIDNELGCKILTEIDILNRLKYPYISSVEMVFEQNKAIILLFPFNEKILRDITNDKYLPSSQKIPILYKISLAINHLHQHNILYLNIKDTNIILRDNEPLLIDFTAAIVVDNIAEGKRLSEKRGKFYAPELLVANIHNEKTDVWGLGMLIMSVLIGGNFYVGNKQYQFFHEDYTIEENVEYQAFVIDVIPNNIELLLQNISSNYSELLIKLLVKIFDINQHHRPTIQEIVHDKLFENYIEEKIEKTKEDEKEIKVSSDTRDTLKLLIYWTRKLYENESMKLLFLAIDLFNKVSCFFLNRTSDERMYLAVASIWMAGKIIIGKEIKLDDHVTIISDIISNANKQDIINMEIEIIQLLKGNLAESPFYNSCSTIDQLAVAFEDIIMSKDSTLYCSTNIEEWITLVRTDLPDGDKKTIMIKEFFG